MGREYLKHDSLPVVKLQYNASTVKVSKGCTIEKWISLHTDQCGKYKKNNHELLVNYEN